MTPAILDEETIEWYSVDDALPDADTTVLLCAPGASEPVWLGYWDGEFWYCAEGMNYKVGAVLAWAEMPAGPELPP